MKKIYGIREKQFRGYVVMAKKRENPGIALLELLERRLDNVVFRLGLAATRPQARQYVSHGLFLLNGRRTYTPSISVKKEDVIRPRRPAMFEESHGKPRVGWLQMGSDLTGKVVNLPERSEIDTPVDESLVLQFYARV